LVERFSRPVFVLSETNGDEAGELCLSGSGRSIPAFHLLEALETMPELFQRFGGHRQAAGLTLAATNLDEFRKRFNQVARGKLTPDDLRPQYEVDSEACLSDLTDRCAVQILSLGPFGFGNPLPTLCCRKVQVAASPRADSSGRHLTIPLRQNGRTLFCKAWNFGPFAESFEPNKEIDVLLKVEDDAYSRKRGYGSWCVSLKDFRAST
jgi:single-stranded-DNA-specific exonuclease